MKLLLTIAALVSSIQAQAAAFTALGADNENVIFVGLQADADPIPKLAQINTGSYRAVVIPLPDLAFGGRVFAISPQGKKVFVTATLPENKVALFYYDLKRHAWTLLSRSSNSCPYLEKVLPNADHFELQCRPAKNQGDLSRLTLQIDRDEEGEPLTIHGGEIKVPQTKVANGLMTAALESDTIDWDRVRISVDGRERVLAATLPKAPRAPKPTYQFKK